MNNGTRAIYESVLPTPRKLGERWVQTAPVTLIDRNNADVRQLGLMSLLEYDMEPDYPHRTWLTPFLSAASNGLLLFIGYGNEYTIRVYDTRGNFVRIIRRAWSTRPITNADHEAFVTEWIKRWVTATGPQGEKEKADIRDDAYAKTTPAYSQFIADRVGRLWVREAHIADAPGAGQLNTIPLVTSVWSVFNPNGAWLGDVKMPPQFMPYDIGSNYVLGKARDADGVETVVKYRLSTPGER